MHVSGGNSLTFVGVTGSNSGPTTGGGGNIVIGSGARDVLWIGTLQDEGWGDAILVGVADRVMLAGFRLYYSGTYGIRLGDGTNNPTNCTIRDVRLEPFSVNVPINTIKIHGSGHRLVNVSTNPNGGGDINDLGTDTSFENVNGRWKYPATDASGTPGNATIHKASGKVAIAAGQGVVVVTNSLVTAASIVMATIQTADATLTFLKSVVPGAGTFTVTGNANATAATTVAFTVQN
jgi:hypothetical protein